jgi:uncharacterized protein (TIGR02271 family)
MNGWLGSGFEAGMSQSKTEERPARSLSDRDASPRIIATPLGEVRVFTEVVTEVKTIAVPVRREQLRIEPVARTKRSVVSAENTFSGSMTIPLYEEEVEVVTRPVLREQVDLAKKLEELQRGAERISVGEPGRGDPDGW